MGVWLRQSKWNIVYQKQHRREREDGIDINGENGNIAAKYFLKELKRLLKKKRKNKKSKDCSSYRLMYMFI